MPPSGYAGRIERPLSITGLGMLSTLGTSPADHVDAISRKGPAFRPLAHLLGNDSPHAATPAGWIEPRELLTHRKWSPASMAALHAARQAVADAGWTPEECRGAAVILGTSRGNAAGWLAPWPGRRPFKLMAASNTIHSEPAAAITIELGIHGPYHVLASGCSAGLDALGIATLMVQSGVVPRALAVAVDLPLVPLLLDSYASSGLLASAAQADPYHPTTAGFIPGEGAAAIAIEPPVSGTPRILGYTANSDACDPIGIPKDGGGSCDLLIAAIERHGRPAAVCPHATGTPVHAIAEPAALIRAFGSTHLPTLHFLKPFTGHTIGASGLLETAILAAFLRLGHLPPNPLDLATPPGFLAPDARLDAAGPVFKISHSMGGHNALLVLSPP
ncbi:beta-ketoacyl synthase N-terminal-like domain-containing protein [Luteolibacter sp. LG18]|uniref:beta-ketoacyl synthase N-terminal-like domain-containing protein n=1 Tax=Luteolibacter sp. LG18 TaxID=2819286 RepID=UPI002B2CF4B5|nr:3-oxoacyl-ACP synthase [Luteolibacter sp. LG18]